MAGSAASLFAADLHRTSWRPLTRTLGLSLLVAIVAAGVIVYARTGGQHPFDSRAALRSAVEDAALPLTLAGFVLGASLLGGDYTSRALSTLLTWEPPPPPAPRRANHRRATVTGGASLAAVLLLLADLTPAALAHSNTGGGALTTGWYLSLAGLTVRCALLAAAAAAIGVSCATIGRSTTAALAEAGICLLLIERTLIGVAPATGRWLLITDAISWLAAHPHPAVAGPGAALTGHTAITAGLLLLAVVLATPSQPGPCVTTTSPSLSKLGSRERRHSGRRGGASFAEQPQLWTPTPPHTLRHRPLATGQMGTRPTDIPPPLRSSRCQNAPSRPADTVRSRDPSRGSPRP